jgi:DNA polymerase
MQENLAILLEWFIANGVSEFFDESVVTKSSTDSQSSFEELSTSRSLGDTIAALAKRQRTLRDLAYGDNTRIREMVDHVNDVNQLLSIIDTIDAYNNFRKMAMNTIVVRGNVNSKILMINDLPGDEDDAAGTIFAGKSGDLFSKMLESIDINYGSVCLLNAFFWRLPGNRAPIVEELEICRPFVEKIIGLLEPKLMIFSGSYSITTLLEKNKTLTSLRGKMLDYDNCYLQSKIKVTGTYSPLFLLKHGERKKDSWSDLLKIKEFLSDTRIVP